MDCFCQALNLPRQVCRVAAAVDLLHCLVIHLVALAAWDDLVDHFDQADVEHPEEDLPCARPVELEVLDQAWDGPVDQVAAVCQVVEVHPCWICLDGHRLESRRI